jgi:hypothetical protein
MGHQESKKSQLTCRRVVGHYFVREGDRQGERSGHGRHPRYPLVLVFGYDLR